MRDDSRATRKEMRASRKSARRQGDRLDRAIELLAENHVRLIAAFDQQTALLHEVRDDLRGQRGTMEAMREDLRSEREAMQAMRDDLRSEREAMQAIRDDLHAQAKILERIARGLGSSGNGKNGGNGRRKR